MNTPNHRQLPLIQGEHTKRWLAQIASEHDEDRSSACKRLLSRAAQDRHTLRDLQQYYEQEYDNTQPKRGQLTLTVDKWSEADHSRLRRVCQQLGCSMRSEALRVLIEYFARHDYKHITMAIPTRRKKAQRTEAVKVMFTLEEKKKVKRFSAAHNLSLAKFVAESALSACDRRDT
jgi:hypothetical protein